MTKLEGIKAGVSLEGVDPGLIVTAAAVVPLSDGMRTVYYKLPDAMLRERLLGRADEAEITVATTARPWSFDGDSEAFKLTAEARRSDLAFLFGPMMAAHTSSVEPLPHQVTAVYEATLPLQPLRYVLADDPGAGTTIMAGLHIRELIVCADARRIRIVAPGGLVEPWRDELFERTGLELRVYSREFEAASPSGNPFEDHDHLILRLGLRKFTEYPEAWDPRSDKRLPVWEALHQLIRAFRKDGETGAGQILGAVKSKTEAIPQLAGRLYTLCERRGWAEDARACNDLVTSWTAIETSANAFPVPISQLGPLGES